MRIDQFDVWLVLQMATNTLIVVEFVSFVLVCELHLRL